MWDVTWRTKASVKQKQKPDFPNLATPNSIGTNFSNTMSLYKALYDKTSRNKQ